MKRKWNGSPTRSAAASASLGWPPSRAWSSSTRPASSESRCWRRCISTPPCCAPRPRRELWRRFCAALSVLLPAARRSAARSYASRLDLWEFVAAGRDGVVEFPNDRGWDLERLYPPDPDHPGTSYAREGGFVEQAGDFDAEFFGIAPREALAMDPQQRLLLESCWEALEGAGIAPDSMRGSQTGVFAGISSQVYMPGSAAAAGGSEGYRITSASTSVASGRVSYALGLEC